MKPTLFTLTLFLGLFAVAGYNSKQPNKTENVPRIMAGRLWSGFGYCQSGALPPDNSRAHTQAYDSLCLLCSRK